MYFTKMNLEALRMLNLDILSIAPLTLVALYALNKTGPNCVKQLKIK